MDLGAGQPWTEANGSGVIAVPDLAGLPNKMMLRDRSLPGIGLRPDLQRVHDAFSRLWHAMQAALMPDDPTAFPSSAFAFGPDPRAAGSDTAFLCWHDGLLLAGAPPLDAAAVSRTAAAFAQVMAPDLGLDPDLATGFGAACGWRLTGVVPAPRGQPACDLVAARLPRSQSPLRAAGGELDGTFWALAAPMLNAIADLFADPSSRTALRTGSHAAEHFI